MQVPRLLKLIIAAVIILSWVLLSGCSEDAEELDEEEQIEEYIQEEFVIDDSEPADVKLASAKLTKANTKFGFKLFSELMEQDTGKNIFISPISIEIALAMTYNGARGETRKAMADTLELGGLSLGEVNYSNAFLIASLGNLDRDVQLEMANSLWAREGERFEPDFMKRNEDFYGAEVATLDFADPAAPGIINGWISEKTQGKIGEMIKRIDESTVLFLINALYFNGTWTVQFDKEKTEARDFILMDGSVKRVPMMVLKSQFEYCPGDGFEAVSLPYGSGRISMYIFLPDAGSRLDEFCRKLNSEMWRSWLGRFFETKVQVVLPRFELEYEVELNDALKALGMEVAFDGRADFDGMCPGVWIDKVKHKAFVNVNEEGTEAAATTVVEMAKSGPVEMVCDRPFFLVIRDNETEALLFMGSVVEP